jgi:hypothetical protein
MPAHFSRPRFCTTCRSKASHFVKRPGFTSVVHTLLLRVNTRLKPDLWHLTILGLANSPKSA